MLALYGHPFSSYTWKALIALYANATPFEFRMVDPDHLENSAFVAGVSPLGKFPVLTDGDRTVFEATVIIEYLHLHHPGAEPLLPADPAAAVEVRMMDRVFDISIMDSMQEVVVEYIRSPENPDPAIGTRVRDRLDRAYRWIDRWLGENPPGSAITLVKCAAAPSLFYADWVHQIPPELVHLRRYRTHLLALPRSSAASMTPARSAPTSH